MKFFATLALVCLSFACSRQPQTKPANTGQQAPSAITRIFQTISAPSQLTDQDIFPSLDKTSLLMRLFDNPKFDANGMAIWKPDFEERQLFGTSWDHKCHSSVDTILFFTDHDNRQCAIAVLATYRYVKEHEDAPAVIDGSHFESVPLGAALFARTGSGGWELYAFKKRFSTLGYYGEYRTGERAGKISLRKIGDNWTCLSLRNGIEGNAGFLSGYEQLFLIEWPAFNAERGVVECGDFDLFDTLFAYNYWVSCCPGDVPCEVTARRLRTVRKKKHCYDIELTVDENGRRHTERYTYREAYGRFVRADG